MNHAVADADADLQHGTVRFTAAVFAVAVAFSTFQVITAAFSPISSTVVRAIHVGFLLLMTFLLVPPFRQRWLGWIIGGVAFVASFYHWIFEADLIQRAGELTTPDMVIGVLTIALVFEAARRVMGIALPLICAAFLLYGLFGQYLPAPLNHRGYGIDQVIGQLGFGTEGIYGTPTYVSSSYIFLFILFGSFLEQVMGTINGSGVANVVTTGQFTIPLMKRFGYKPAFAGGVEATASMGGQIMPPVMGAVAFIMSETINVPYVEICKAALVPALLYFLTAFVMVHLEAGRAGLLGIPKDECPNPWRAVKERWYLVLPLLMLVFLLFSGYTPLFSGMVSLALTVVLIFGFTLASTASVRSWC